MAPPGTAQTLLSPAELSFLHSSLALSPPIRPDLRTPTQFRPLVAETDILASANGSARICFSDGTEAIAGVKAEVEKSQQLSDIDDPSRRDEDIEMQDSATSGVQNEGSGSQRVTAAASTWLEVSIEIPGFRDDDNLPVFLSAMLTETLLASETLKEKLWINQRWHWKLYIDILLLSPPLSYPLPLLSLTTHLALLNCALPRLTSEPSDDPLFDDDWAAAVPMYPHSSPKSPSRFLSRPPITLLVMTVADNIIFDPSKEELAVAESVLAVSVAPFAPATSGAAPSIQLLAIRTVDPPSRLTPLGVPNSLNPATGGDPAAVSSTTPAKASNQSNNSTQQQGSAAAQEAVAEKEKGNLWSPPRGGIKRDLVSRIVKMVVGEGGVAEEVLAGLAAVEV